jgi:hypothetical protein
VRERGLHKEREIEREEGGGRERLRERGREVEREILILTLMTV